MLTRRTVLALLLVGVGLFALAKPPSAAPEVPKASSGSGWAASPSAPEALVPRDWTLFGSGPDVLPGPVRADGAPALPAVHRPSKTRQRSDLSAALVLEKYRSFRESLTSP